MNYLLDTHTLIWAITENEKLSLIVQQTLENNNNTIFISAISFWEVALKFPSGKLEFQGFLPEDLPKLSLESGFQLLPLSPDESSTYHKLALTNHKDPFDRMLIWQAINRDLIFISKDKHVTQYNVVGLKTLW